MEQEQKIQAMKLLKILSEAFGPSTMEDSIIQIIRDEFSDDFSSWVTPHKNLIIYPRKSDFEKTVVFQAHLDELGVRPYRYRDDGFIELTPTGGIPRGISNHRIVFRPGGVRGVLIEQKGERKRHLFADIGAKDSDEAKKLVPYHANGAFLSVPFETSDTHLMGKSLDDRAGCAAIVSAFKKGAALGPNRVVGVFTAREETGNWPVDELYMAMKKLHILPDLIVNVECCPGGPVPGNPDPLAEVGKGIVLVNMDASYEPDSRLCKFMEALAANKSISNQMIAIRDGSGELGRLALGFGVAGYPLTIPCRYMHFPHSVIAKNDYFSCIEMLGEIARSIHHFNFGLGDPVDSRY